MFGFDDLARFQPLASRSITAGNPTGGKGGRGSEEHAVDIPAHGRMTLADVAGPGCVRGIWMTIGDRSPESLRSLLLRISWDDHDAPSVEAPFGDFFGALHGRLGHYSTPCLGISEGKGFWCFFPMPFGTRFVFELENDQDRALCVFYQISYTLGDEVGPDQGRFHAHFRRQTVPMGERHRIMQTEGTPGVYVGTAISGLPLSPGTWREGEFQFYIDGDGEAPTINGTGWSDWFLSAWGLGRHESMYGGCNYQVRHPEFGDRYFCSCYRFHLMDPVHFASDLRVEHTQQGWKDGGFHARSDDWCSVAYWYQRPGAVLDPMPSREERLRGIAVQDWEAEALERIRARKLPGDSTRSGMVF